MEQGLTDILKLQEIDLKIHELEMSKVEFPLEVTKRNEQIALAEKAFVAAQQKNTDYEASVQAQNDTIANAQSHLDKSGERLNSISTNREYDAVHAEIENFKSSINHANVKIKNLTAEKEKYDAFIADAQVKLDAVKQENEGPIAELTARIASIDSLITDQIAAREEVKPNIPKDLVSTYEFIRKKRKNGKVLSLVKDGRTCGICRKVLEQRLLLDIRKAKKIVSCEACGSMLIWLPDTDVPASLV